MYLQGKKISLRSVLPADAPALHKWENDKANLLAGGRKKPYSQKEIKDFIANQKDIYLDKQLRLMICIPPLLLKEKGLGDEVIGCIDLFDFNAQNLSVGIGILIEKKFRKKGYASDALWLLITYSFEILHLAELNCSIAQDNKASIQLFQKQKFRKTGEKNKVLNFQLINPSH